MYKVIVLDFDGTILDSYRSALSRLELLAKQNNLIVTQEIREKMLRAWGQSGIAFLQNVFSIGRERAESMYQEWEKIDVERPIPIINGTHCTLNWLDAKGLLSCMVSSRHRQTLIPILWLRNLRSYFVHITAGDDTPPYHKPDPRVFAPLFKELGSRGIPKEECLFVGDTATDAEAGMNVGIQTVIVETGPYRENHTEHRVPEDHVIASIKDLPEWLSQRLD